MSASLKRLGGYGAGAAIAGGVLYVVVHSVQTGLAQGAGPVQLTPTGALTAIVSALTAWGFTKATAQQLLALVLEWWNAPPGAKRALTSALSTGVLVNYANLYRDTKDATAKTQLRSAAKLEADALFAEWFPVEAAQ